MDYRIVPYARRAETHFKLLRERCDQALRRVQEPVPSAVEEELRALAQAGLLEDFIDSVLAPAFAGHFKQYGWAIELPCTLHEAVSALADGRTRLPDAYLQAVFPSFWHAGRGLAARATEEEFWKKVLRYPCGLNETGEVYNEITLASMRKSCRAQRKTVSWFSAAKALRIYEKHLDARQEKVRIWDPSGGFGARMLAAAAWGKKHKVPVTYVACEPASMTFGDLCRLGAALERLAGAGFVPTVLNCGSEHAQLRGQFDLVLTSPPYFATERYFDEPGQCWRDYPKWEQWKGAYLHPTVERAKAVLRPGGKLILNVKHDAGAWQDAMGKTTALYGWPVKAGPFARARGQVELNEHLLVWEKS